MLTRRAFLGRACVASAHAAILGAGVGCVAPDRRGAARAPEAPLPEPVVAPPGAPMIEHAEVSSGPLLLPSPDCSPGRVMRCVAGVRPYREGGVRIEVQRVGDHWIAHHYGHGGAGITLAPGTAAEVVRRLASLGAPLREAAVLGAGVAGLMTAHTLLDAGCRVTIYTDRLPRDTTSWVAGGQWAPAGVGAGTPGFARHCAEALRWYERRLGEEFGVFRRPNYVVGPGGGGFSRLPRGLLPAARTVDPLPFAGATRRGLVYETLLVEPPRMLTRLSEEVFERCESVERRRFVDADEFLDLPERTVVNCLGLGARDVAGDASVVPIRGQLALLEAQDLPYLLSHRGYMFPRSDAVVLGGTYERGVESLAIDAPTCDRIRRRTESFFMS
ncbi:MAG: FAD-dependent oxidoreductase [Phycisphaerales bacterium]